MKAIRVLILKSKDLQGEIVEEGMVRNLMLESYLYLIVSLVAWFMPDHFRVAKNVEHSSG